MWKIVRIKSFFYELSSGLYVFFLLKKTLFRVLDLENFRTEVCETKKNYNCALLKCFFFTEIKVDM